MLKLIKTMTTDHVLRHNIGDKIFKSMLTHRHLVKQSKNDVLYLEIFILNIVHKFLADSLFSVIKTQGMIFLQDQSFWFPSILFFIEKTKIIEGE